MLISGDTNAVPNRNSSCRGAGSDIFASRFLLKRFIGHGQMSRFGHGTIDRIVQLDVLLAISGISPRSCLDRDI